MSWSTLLIGNVEFNKGKTYDEVKEAIYYFCKYSGVDKPDIIEQYDDNMNKLSNSTNGAYIIIGNDAIKLFIQDINWASERDVYTLNALLQIVAKYKDLIDNVGFSLYYLQKEDIMLFSDKPLASLINYVCTLTPDAKFYCDCKYYKNEDDIKELVIANTSRYYDELIKDGIIDEKKLMLYKLKEKEEEDD